MLTKSNLVVYLAFHFFLFQVLLIVPSIYPVTSSEAVKHSVFESPVDMDYIEKHLYQRLILDLA